MLRCRCGLCGRIRLGGNDGLYRRIVPVQSTAVETAVSELDPRTLDPGIREIVLLLRKAGYKTFTSCEGGRGHAFREPTVGLKFKGDYFALRDQLVTFLHSQGRRLFEVVLVSSYLQGYPKGKHYVYLQGFDIASAETRKKMARTMRRRDRRLLSLLAQLEANVGRLKAERELYAGAECPMEWRGPVTILDQRTASDYNHRPRRHGCPASLTVGSLRDRSS